MNDELPRGPFWIVYIWTKDERQIRGLGDTPKEALDDLRKEIDIKYTEMKEWKNTL